MAARRGQSFRILLCAAACFAVALGCSKPKAKSKSPSAAESATESPDLASSVAPQASAMPMRAPSIFAHKPVPRDSIKTPPLSPPPEALAGPAGVRYQVIKPGTGPTPGPIDTIVVDANMWTAADGHLASSSYTEDRSTVFSLTTLAPQFRGMLTQIHQGSTVRYWIPRAALSGWKPDAWPDADLIIEFELLLVNHNDSRDGMGNQIQPGPSTAPPDAAGPPADASKTAHGLRYVYLTHGTATAHPTTTTRIDLILDAYAVDGLIVGRVATGAKTATTLDHAPANLNEILAVLVTGDRVRIWLPPGVGKLVVPDVGDRDAILDLAATF